MGYVSFAVTSIVNAVSCFFTPFFIVKYGNRRCIQVGFFMSIFYYLLFLFCTYYDQLKVSVPFMATTGFQYLACIVGSIIFGTASSLLWIGQGDYYSQLPTEKTKGLFFSIFWAIYMSSSIFGNLIGSYLLGYFN